MNIKVAAFTVSEKSSNIVHMETVMLKRLNRNHWPQFPEKNQQQQQWLKVRPWSARRIAQFTPKIIQRIIT